MDKPPRVRIAPSPTGDPHVGTAYIALFNYVYAKRHGGQFILRIEDTDQERSSRSSELTILEALRWLGLSWDEGPDVGGPHGPYRQSERLPLYKEAVDTLLEKGAAYRCFCTKERLDELRKIQRAEKKPPGYDRHCRDIDVAAAKERADGGEAHVVRLKVPLSGETIVADGVGDRGNVRFENRLIDDQVILKSDGFPTYHLANVVDDHNMGITDVIRGEEWITSTPKHILLYQAFGWEPPNWYHLGLLRNSDKSKLSKRKNPVSINHYRALGYLPETFLNFLGTLGFSMGDDVERFSLEQMVEAFDWAKVSAGGPVFDPVKLEAFNGEDIRAMDLATLKDKIAATVLSDERITALLEQAQERITRLDDFIPYVSFFFGEKVDYTPVLDKLKLKKKRSRKEITGILKVFLEAIERDPRARAFDKDGLEAFAREFCEEHGWKSREIFTLLRLSATGRTAAPPLFDTLVLLGKDRVRSRIRDVIAYLNAQEEWKAPEQAS